MADVFGTGGSDFFHVSGDGLTAPPGYIDTTYSPGDFVFGNSGGDIFIGSGSSTRYFTDFGYDVLDYSGFGEGIRIDSDGGVYLQSDGSLIANFATFPDRGFQELRGTAFDDTLVGTEDNTEALIGNGGNDVLTGSTGAEVLDGGTGADTMAGNGGNDRLQGSAGADVLDGGSDIDSAEYFNAPSAVNVDLLAGTGTLGDALGDIFVSIENLGGSAFADSLKADNLDNAISGLDGNDGLDGRGGTDTLSGDAGDDVLRGGAGADTLDGGAGIDFASYFTAATGVTASLLNPAGNTGDAAGDSYVSIESLQGSDFDDTLVGNDAGNVIIGLGGADTIAGNGADDVLRRGRGGDSLDGGGGSDRASYANATAEVVASLSAPAGNTGDAAGDSYVSVESLEGSQFNDTLTGDAGGNLLIGLGGVDAMAGGSGDDTYVVANAGDTVDEASGTGTDRVSSTVTFTLPADVEVLVLNGTAAIDGTGNDSANLMFGNSAANRLDGNGGADTMTGFGGADVFVFDDGDGADTVTGFQNGSDQCDLTAVAGVDAFSDLVLTDTGSGVNVDYGTGSFELANVANLAAIDASDFIFA